ncbi:MAG: cytochrome P450, partial [Rubrobacter sp.]|nr:cytochrome P450 [Rubrobacter sp.]
YLVAAFQNLARNPNDIEQVLVTDNRNFDKDRDTRHALRFLGDGLLTSEGSFWRRQRRLMQPAFHRERVEAYAEVMVSYAERMLTGWRDGEVRDIHEEMMRLTLEIVARCLFDADVAAEARDVGEALDAVMEHSTEQGAGALLSRVVPEAVPTPRNLRLRRAIRRLDEVVHRIIERRRASGEDPGDLLSMMLRAEDEDGKRMSDKQLKDEVLTIVTAGHETTALALSWTFFLLSEHPEVEAKLLEELDNVLGGRAPAVGDLTQLRYATAVVKESMRLYPPVWAIGREATEDCEVGGYQVPAGTQMFISQWVVHRDGRLFEKPEAFRPERWLDGSERELPKFAYFPFGGGPRLCIGKPFAEMEAGLLLAAIARRFRLTAVAKRRPLPQPSITLRPGGGVRITLEQRRTRSRLET